MKVEFYKHNVGAGEIKAVSNALTSTFLTTGPITKEFEFKFSNYLGVSHTLGFSSWTSAAFLVLKAWGIGPGDEVIVPSMTFIATANVVLQNGAKVVFCDSESITGNINLDHIESLITKNTRVIIPVHLYGQMVNMRKLKIIAEKYNIKILEDCAHNIEGSRDGYRPGHLSDAAVFSFYATKNITSGEGGAVSTNSKSLIEKLILLRNHGMDKSAADRYSGVYKHWDMRVLGYKANMFDIQAAMLLSQLKKIDQLLKKKESICQYYQQRFDDAGILYPKVIENSISARHLFTILVDPDIRDKVLISLQGKDIGVAVNFRAVHTLSYYQNYLSATKVDLKNAEIIGNSTITLPMYPRLTQKEIKYVADSVIAAVNNAS